MEWNVVYHNINKDKIEIYNIFKHGGFREEVKSHLKECENKEEFENKLKRSLMYYFWSKCEWEVVVSPWCGSRNNENIKIDVYNQVMTNWNIFLDYVWKHKETPKHKWRTNKEDAAYILEFIKKNYENHNDRGVLKYIDALEMGIEALKNK